MKKKYLKIFSKAVRRMKLKLYMHAYDINLYKVCVFIVLVQLLWLLCSLKFPLSYTGKSGNCQFLLFHWGYLNFICSVALHDFMPLLFKLLNLIGCYVNIKDEFLKKKSNNFFSEP